LRYYKYASKRSTDLTKGDGWQTVALFIASRGIITQKKRKVKLWKVEMTVDKEDFERLLIKAKMQDLTLNYIDIEKWVLVNFYCETQEESHKVKELAKQYNTKYFVSETKSL
jgi:hypothetical protein